MKLCPMCDTPVTLPGNRAKYCSTECKIIAKRARDRVFRQNRKFKGFLRCCNKCNMAYDSESTGNRKYCQKCKEKAEAEPKLRKCLNENCETIISIKKKRCSKHQKEIYNKRKKKNNEKLTMENETILKEAKRKGITKDDFKIPSEFLERGDIHYAGYSRKL